MDASAADKRLRDEEGAMQLTTRMIAFADERVEKAVAAEQARHEKETKKLEEDKRKLEEEKQKLEKKKMELENEIRRSITLAEAERREKSLKEELLDRAEKEKKDLLDRVEKDKDRAEKEKKDLLDRVEKDKDRAEKEKKEIRDRAEKDIQDVRDRADRMTALHLKLATSARDMFTPTRSRLTGILEDNRPLLDTHGANITRSLPKSSNPSSPMKAIFRVRSGLYSSVRQQQLTNEITDIYHRPSMITRTIVDFKPMTNPKGYCKACGQQLEKYWQANKRQLEEKGFSLSIDVDRAWFELNKKFCNDSEERDHFATIVLELTDELLSVGVPSLDNSVVRELTDDLSALSSKLDGNVETLETCFEVKP
ncbi:hypothetical protein PHYBOEH_006485 [Phytophthora boehmeriae]|uniref:Uncharacterized protein n=1 Tax=Phytophthora boehmeriae TaxID=109152 RepID=A0A8T1WI66_9STRA|nr:hypothetical protein PHYBOEH_006485 [Phytophthora boehmeriae]